jgi:type I restriction enzyme R subunit
VQTVDRETLRIIYEQIQELSNMGDHEQAQLLREFVDTELVPGNLSSSLNFDEAFEIWKADKLRDTVIQFSTEWGLDSELLTKAVNSYSTSEPDIVPFINDLIRSVDFNKATNQTAGNLLRHNMILTTKLPQWIAETKQKYS